VILNERALVFSFTDGLLANRTPILEFWDSGIKAFWN